MVDFERLSRKFGVVDLFFGVYLFCLVKEIYYKPDSVWTESNPVLAPLTLTEFGIVYLHAKARSLHDGWYLKIPVASLALAVVWAISSLCSLAGAAALSVLYT